MRTQQDTKEAEQLLENASFALLQAAEDTKSNNGGLFDIVALVKVSDEVNRIRRRLRMNRLAREM